MRRLGVIAAVAVVVAALAAGGLWIYLKQQFEAPGPLREQAVVIVPRGAGLATIAKDLAAAGVIEDTYIFRVGVRLFGDARALQRSEEHTSELQSLMRISYAGFCLKKKK